MRNKPSKRVHCFSFRRFVDSIDKRRPSFLHKLGHSLVCGDHELFDDLVSQASLCPNDILCLPLEIEDDLGFWKIEINGSPCDSFLAKFLTEIRHEGEGGKEKAELFPEFRFPVHQDFSNPCVGQPLIASDHTGIKSNFPSLSLSVISQLGRKSQPVYSGLKTTDVIGELGREHGNRAVWKIDAGPPGIRFVVQGTPFFDIVTDTRDRNIELDASFSLSLNGT